MTEQVTYWRSNDGKDFPTKRESLEHEAWLALLKIIEKQLPSCAGNEDVLIFIKENASDIHGILREITLEIPRITQFDD